MARATEFPQRPQAPPDRQHPPSLSLRCISRYRSLHQLFLRHRLMNAATRLSLRFMLCGFALLHQEVYRSHGTDIVDGITLSGDDVRKFPGLKRSNASVICIFKPDSLDISFSARL